MIHDALTFLEELLNDQLPDGGGTPVVAVSGIVAPGDGALAVTTGLALALVNVEREASAPRGQVRRPVDNAYEVLAAPLNLNLYVLLAAPDAVHATALEHLSRAMGLLNARPLHARESGAALPVGIERLSVELCNLGFADLNHLWAMHGGRYIPSALYKLRVVVLTGDEVLAKDEMIAAVDARGRPR